MPELTLDYLKISLGIVAFLATSLMSFPASAKAWAELRQMVRVRRRVEFEFALRLFDNCPDPQLKRYAEEVGYAALVGDRHLTHEQRKLLLSQRDAEYRIEVYMRTQHVLEVSLEKPGFIWKSQLYNCPDFRQRVRWLWFSGYLACGVLAFSPWLVWTSLHPSSNISASVMAAEALFFPVFFLLAITCLVFHGQVSDAEKLMQDVGVESSANQSDRTSEGARSIQLEDPLKAKA